jgi:MbtH protein
MQGDEDLRIYKVVVNQEEQYSIWSSHRPIPNGWRDAGVEGNKKECLDHIEKVWVDMRPLSLRRQMDSAAPK